MADEDRGDPGIAPRSRNRRIALLTLTGLALLVFWAAEPRLFPAYAGAFAMTARVLGNTIRVMTCFSRSSAGW